MDGAQVGVLHKAHLQQQQQEQQEQHKISGQSKNSLCATAAPTTPTCTLLLHLRKRRQAENPLISTKNHPELPSPTVHAAQLLLHALLWLFLLTLLLVFPLVLLCSSASSSMLAHQVRLCCLLQRQQRIRLEAEVILELLAHLAHQPLERALAQQQLCGLLVLLDLTAGSRERTWRTCLNMHSRELRPCFLAILRKTERNPMFANVLQCPGCAW